MPPHFETHKYSAVRPRSDSLTDQGAPHLEKDEGERRSTAAIERFSSVQATCAGEDRVTRYTARYR